jgi:PAS domain S-box-containing protein
MVNTPTPRIRTHEARVILIVGIFVVLISIFFGVGSLLRFSEVEKSGNLQYARDTATNDALMQLNGPNGYWGYVQRLKRVSTGAGVAGDREVVASNISELREQLDQLAMLFEEDQDKAAVAQLRAVVEEYASTYARGLSSPTSTVDRANSHATGGINDAPAVQAIFDLNTRAAARAKAGAQRVQRTQDDALRFVWAGGLFVIVSVIGVAVTTMVYLRRIVAANKLVLKTQAQLDMLLDSAPDAMVSADRAGNIVRANAMAERFFGYSRAELLQMQVEHLIPMRFRAAHPGMRESFYAAGAARPMGSGRALLALTKDGREPHVEISLSHSGEGAQWLATVTVRDVTQREEYKRGLEAARHSAEVALARQKEMQGALVQTEMLAALGGMVAGVAHEINTPVGITLSAATFLDAQTQQADRAYQEGELTEEGLAEYFATARKASQLMTLNSQRAADLIQSFKQVAVDQTGGDQRTFNLAAYINEILFSLMPRLRKTKIGVTVDCPAELTMDSVPGALSQVLTNFIMNSLTHAFEPDQDGKIHISACAEDDDHVRIVYSDDGRGIAPELHSKVFEPFFTTRRSAGGSGLGLHIVHTIVTQSLKGSITLASSPGHGVKFTLSLPRKI